MDARKPGQLSLLCELGKLYLQIFYSTYHDIVESSVRGNSGGTVTVSCRFQL
jgi:hypothetical protein